MSDITERLRAPRCGLPMSASMADRDMYNVATREEAADEIDRLRAELAEAKEAAHLADGVAKLAMQHRDEAERQLAEAKAQRVPAVSTPDGTTHIRKTGRRSYAGGEYAMFYECFKLDGSEWFYYYSDSDNEYAGWWSLNGGRYRNPKDIVKELICVDTKAQRVPDDVALWPFLRDVLRRGAAIESQFSQQGYETFISEIEHAARGEHKKLRAMLAASQKEEE